MDKRFHSFSRRLTNRIILVMLITMTITSSLVFIFSAADTVAMISDHYRDILKMTNERMEGMLKVVEVSSTNNVDEIRKHLSKPDEILSALQNELMLNPHIVGCGVAFVEDYYPDQGKWFEPYISRNKHGSVEVRQIGSADHDYSNTEWFVKGLESKTGYWSEPYMDESGAGEMIGTFALPVLDDDGRIAGVFGADISLSWLTEQIQEIGLNAGDFGYIDEPDGKGTHPTYSFILGRNGNYLAHPDPSRILDDNYFNHRGGDKAYERTGREMLEGKSGSRRVKVDGVPSFVSFAPLRHDGWSMGIVVPYASIRNPGLILGLTTLLLIGLGLILAFFLIRKTIHSTAKPLKYLVRSTEAVSEGHFDTPLPELHHYDEIHQLRDSFEHMQHSLTRYVEELKEATSRQASMERELDIARDIQMSMLPKTFPPFPERDDIDISVRLTPAKAVGGDLYDYFIKDDRLFFCIGDVSGKGVPAAMVMAVTETLFRTLAAKEDDPALILSGLNENLYLRNDSLMFVTLFFGILDLRSGRLSYCNAGHDAPVVIGPDGTVQLLEVEPNLSLAIDSGFGYVQQEVTLKPGTTLFLYTDGLTEAENQTQDLFGTERVLTAIEEADKDSPTSIIGHMSSAVSGFVSGAEQNDDLTMIAIRYH